MICPDFSIPSNFWILGDWGLLLLGGHVEGNRNETR